LCRKPWLAVGQGGLHQQLPRCRILAEHRLQANKWLALSQTDPLAARRPLARWLMAG
jgi:hypothetical protein